MTFTFVRAQTFAFVTEYGPRDLNFDFRIKILKLALINYCESMSHTYYVTAHKSTAVTACLSGKLWIYKLKQIENILPKLI